MIKKAFLFAILVALCLWLASCQTVAGVGGDIKWSAEATADMLEGH